MTKLMKIDFVSDVSCPWCVIGLKGLEEALNRVGDLIEADIHLQPFELNPQMPAEGENMVEHITRKYGSAPADYAARREQVRSRAAGVGFTIATSEESRIYNTFDAHRLLHWAGIEGRQLPLKHELFKAYFTDGLNPGDHDVLVGAAERAGLDPEQAAEVLLSGRYTDEVRAAEHLWHSRGISSVPAIIVNERYLISGGQPPEAFEQAIRQIAAQG